MTNQHTAQVPKLRFPGFEGEWKDAELGYYTQTITSGSRDWAQYYAETGSKFVRMTNLPRGGIQLLLDDMRYVALPEDSSEGTRTSLQAEDILISITAELGKIGWIPPNFGEAYINQHTALVRLDHTKADSRFVAHSLSSERMNRRINRLNDAGAKAGLNLPTIRELDTVFPTLPEQQKIAAFLTAVDGRIEQLSRKKALLEEYKTGVMQQLFTQTLRFQDDHGHDFPDWEEKTLGDFFTFKNGYNAEKDQYGKGTKFINVLDVLSSKLITHDSILGRVDIPEKEFAKFEVTYGDILFQRSSETREEVGQANVYLDREHSAVFGGFVIRGKPIREFDPLFMNYLLRTPIARNEITSKSGGSTRYNVSQDTLAEARIVLPPSLPEQTKIAGFLSALDGKIGAVGEQMRQTQAWKKGLLQQLFV